MAATKKLGEDAVVKSGAVTDPAPGSDEWFWDEAGRIEDEENRRFGIAEDALATSRDALSKLVDPNLMFSRASDTIGARAKGAVEQLRRSLGGRNIRPDYAGAQARRLAADQSNALVGATTDITLANQQQRLKNAALSFAQAVSVANMPVSGVKFETGQMFMERDLTREGIQAMRDSQDKASSDNKMGSLGGGLFSLGSAAFGK